MTSDELAILGDDRLSPEARVVGLLVLTAGEAGLMYPDLECLLPDASRDRLRRAVQILERTKWVVRVAGGRAHGDRFVYLASAEHATYVGFRVAILGHLKDRMPATANLNTLSVPASPNLRPPSSSTTPVPQPERVREDVENSVVTDQALEAITESESQLTGCRDSLRDYLAARVEPRNQHGYVRRLVASLDGADEWMWSDRSGRRLTSERPKIIAAALNELLAGDEVGTHFPDSPGGFGNLRSKVRYLVASNLGLESDVRQSERKRQSAADEEAELQAKREAARSRIAAADTQAKERLAKEAAEQARQLAEAKVWLESQDEEMQVRVNMRYTKGLRRLAWTGDPLEAPSYIAGPAMLQAINEMRSVDLEASA